MGVVGVLVPTIACPPCTPTPMRNLRPRSFSKAVQMIHTPLHFDRPRDRLATTSLVSGLEPIERHEAVAVEIRIMTLGGFWSSDISKKKRFGISIASWGIPIFAKQQIRANRRTGSRPVALAYATPGNRPSRAVAVGNSGAIMSLRGHCLTGEAHIVAIRSAPSLIRMVCRSPPTLIWTRHVTYSGPRPPHTERMNTCRLDKLSSMVGPTAPDDLATSG